MQKIDKRFLMAAVLFTIFALIGYFTLSFIARKYIFNMTASGTGFEQAPLIFIETIQGYWWFGYLLLLGMLILQWIIKRVMR